MNFIWIILSFAFVDIPKRLITQIVHNRKEQLKRCEIEVKIHMFNELHCKYHTFRISFFWNSLECSTNSFSATKSRITRVVNSVFFDVSWTWYPTKAARAETRSTNKNSTVFMVGCEFSNWSKMRIGKKLLFSWQIETMTNYYIAI